MYHVSLCYAGSIAREGQNQDLGTGKILTSKRAELRNYVDVQVSAALITETRNDDDFCIASRITLIIVYYSIYRSCFR
jgi:hypothetical protein